VHGWYHFRQSATGEAATLQAKALWGIGNRARLLALAPEEGG
jgi:hypothetical protein